MQPSGESLDQLTLQLPDSPARPLSFDAETDSQVHKATLQRQARGSVVVFEDTREKGLLIGKGGLYGNVLRVAPPLSITAAEASEGLDIIEAAVDEVGSAG